MHLDSLETRQRRVALLERYGALLTDRQREGLEMHLLRDWSISEIAGRLGTSRAGVHDLLRRALAALEEADRRLGLLAEDRRRRLAAGRLSSEVSALHRRLGLIESRLESI